MNHTMSQKRIPTDDSEDGYLQGVKDALADPNEARDYLANAAHYLAWIRESRHATAPATDDDAPL